jgi:hypothetical protein
VVTQVSGSSTEELSEAPQQLALMQNYPNPFNPSTLIHFELPNAGQVKLEVYNILGKKIATLIDEVKNQGAHQVLFEASGISSGVYFYRIEFEGQVLTNKMMLLK